MPCGRIILSGWRPGRIGRGGGLRSGGAPALVKEIAAAGIMGTPANSACNELVIEAGRLSILNGGREAVIHYGENARVALA